MYQMFDFSTFSIMSKVLKQANFCTSLKNSRAEIEVCANCLALLCDKTIQDRGTIFCSKGPMTKVLQNITSQYFF